MQVSSTTGSDTVTGNIEYSSSNNSIATISDSGLITAKADGSTDIKATLTINGEDIESNIITITVSNRADIQSINVYTDEDMTKAYNDNWTNSNLYIKINPANAGDVSEYQYSLNNSNWNTLESNTLTYSTEGLNKIYFRVKDKDTNTYSEPKYVTVKIDKTKPSVTLKNSDITINDSINIKSNTDFTVSASDDLSNINIIKYKLDDGGETSINNNETITINKAGSHTLVLKAVDNANNKIEKTYTINYIDFTIKLDKDSIEAGEKTKISVTKIPNSIDGNVTYSSNDEGIVMVDSNTLEIIGNGVGNATITVTYTVEDISITKSVDITIKQPKNITDGEYHVDKDKRYLIIYKDKTNKSDFDSHINKHITYTLKDKDNNEVTNDDKYITTGYTLTTNNVEYKIIVMGDVNNDGLSNSTDALLILRHTVKLTTLEGEYLFAGNVNYDNLDNSADALKILRYSVNLINDLK